jgi:D-alanyl-D-alanine carboxypeptidase (penicillin-binding protein 5/6)
VAQKDKVVSAVPVSGGKTRVVDAVAESDFHVTYDLLGKSLPATVESKVISLNTEAPIAVGDIVGKLNVFLGEKQVGAVNLLAAQEVERSPLQATIASLVRWNVPPIGTILIVASVGYLVRYFYVATSSKSNRRRRTRLPTTR